MRLFYDQKTIVDEAVFDEFCQDVHDQLLNTKPDISLEQFKDKIANHLGFDNYEELVTHSPVIIDYYDLSQFLEKEAPEVKAQYERLWKEAPIICDDAFNALLGIGKESGQPMEVPIIDPGSGLYLPALDLYPLGSGFLIERDDWDNFIARLKNSLAEKKADGDSTEELIQALWEESGKEAIWYDPGEHLDLNGYSERDSITLKIVNELTVHNEHLQNYGAPLSSIHACLKGVLDIEE